MTDLFFATYDEPVLLTKAWKMHDALTKVVVHNVILIELASYSNSARYTGGKPGGKLAINRHPDTCPILKSGTYRWTSRGNQGSYHATSSCMGLLESIQLSTTFIRVV